MAFSVFSKPLGRGRLGSYNWGGAAIGAGAGAALAGRDHRTSGAVIGGVAGNMAGLGVSYLHGSRGGMSPEIAEGVASVRGAASEFMGMMRNFRRG